MKSRLAHAVVAGALFFLTAGAAQAVIESGGGGATTGGGLQCCFTQTCGAQIVMQCIPSCAPPTLCCSGAGGCNPPHATAKCIICPGGGGEQVTVDGEEVCIVTAASPLGKAVLGKRLGETFGIKIGRDAQTFRIADVE